MNKYHPAESDKDIFRRICIELSCTLSVCGKIVRIECEDSEDAERVHGYLEKLIVDTGMLKSTEQAEGKGTK